MSHPTAPSKTRLTREEFIAFQALPENADKWFEFIDGEIYSHGVIYGDSASMPTGLHLHSWVISRLMELLILFVSPKGLGRVYSDGTGYDLPSGDSLIPDVSFIIAERIPDFSGRIAIAPDLAVEVISPSNTFAEMRRKIELYLSNGTSRVWMIYPDERVIEIYQTLPDGRLASLRLHEDDTLNDADFLPDFSVRVSDLFPKG
jgi:Uma2 family endonuclease